MMNDSAVIGILLGRGHGVGFDINYQLNSPDKKKMNMPISNNTGIILLGSNFAAECRFFCSVADASQTLRILAACVGV
jgi:hypothetical protein